MQALLPALALLAMSILAYIPAFSATYIWDDDAYVTGNPFLKDAAGLHAIWFKWGATPDYYPLTFTTFWLEHQVWQDNPHGYHAVNIVLHGIGAVLLWRVLLRLRMSPGVAFVAAAVFAVHPVHVESVAWICERKNVLSGILYFLAMLSFFRFYRYEDDEPIAARRWPWLVMTIALYLLAELAKTVALTLPLVLLAIIWWKRGRVTLREIAIAVVMLALGAPLCYPAMWTQHHIVGAYGTEFDQTLAQRVLIAGRVLWFYAGKIVWPAELIFIYPKWSVAPGVWWQWLFPITAAATPVVLWIMRRRIGRGPLAAALCFGVTLAPAVGFFRIYWHRYTYVADHVQHLASTALVVLLVAAGAAAIARFARSRPRVPVIVSAIVLFALGARTFAQAFVYRDAMTLWEHTIEHDPDSWMAISNRGVQYELINRLDLARKDYVRAIEINPDHYESLTNLALILRREKNDAEAEKLLIRALKAHPRYTAAYNTYAQLMIDRGDTAEAVALQRKALEQRPGDYETRYQLAIALARRAGDVPGADSDAAIAEGYQHFAVALNRPGDDAMTLRAMARFLEMQGVRGRAVAFYRRALAKDDKDVESIQRLAWILATAADDKVRDGVEALRLAQRGADLTRGQAPEMLDALAAAYAENGRFDEAAALASRTAEATRAMAAKVPPPASQRALALANDMARRAQAYAEKRPWRESPR